MTAMRDGVKIEIPLEALRIIVHRAEMSGANCGLFAVREALRIGKRVLEEATPAPPACKGCSWPGNCPCFDKEAEE